jgi:hypothetical protein
MMPSWITTRRSIEVPCTIDLEQTTESLHAYVDIEGIEICPGDTVIVHDAPTSVAFGDRLLCDRRATVVRAGVLGDIVARLKGYLELTGLYEVSFSDGRAS